MLEKKPRLLIIDDKMETVALLMSYLEGQSIDIRIALDGQDGLRKAIKVRPDAILLDVNMPNMDGYAVCRKLKSMADTADVPIIFLSGNCSLEDKLEGFSAGGADYVCKPFLAEEVLARIFVHLRLQRRLVHIESITDSDAPRTEDEVVCEADPVIEAIAYLQQSDGEWPGLVELARRVGTNEKKLTELFRNRFGMPVFEYLIELRLESARKCLERTDLAIKLIADRTHYSNASAFTRAFRRRYGLGPKAYRHARRSTPVARGS